MSFFLDLPQPQAPASERRVLSVSDLNRQAKRLLEVSFPCLWIEGELSNLARPQSGHWYFTLKDQNAQVQCAMFRGANKTVRFQPTEGMQVLMRAKVSLYEGRGNYQLIVEHMEETGDGALQRAFEQLKHRLAAEGLFEQAHKKNLPAMATHIAVVTSPTGAAIRDILTVFQRRFPAMAITVVPTAVQGSEAALQIVHALAQAQQLEGVDAIIVGRGGGSLEDLWPFNEETVARAIAACSVPVVSAIGHEVDVTIADFTADRRAPTPSAAAEILSPSQVEISNIIRGYRQSLTRLISQQLSAAGQTLDHLQKRMRHPGERLREQSQRLDDLDIRLRQGIRHTLQQMAVTLGNRRERLQTHNPASTVQHIGMLHQQLTRRLKRAMHALLENKNQSLATGAVALDAYSPLATLERGYSITQDAAGNIVTNSEQLAAGDCITTRLAHGTVSCQVVDSHTT